MFLDQPSTEASGSLGSEPWNYSLMSVLACATIVFGLYWAPVIALAERSLKFFIGKA
jgi:hypothetical protein